MALFLPQCFIWLTNVAAGSPGMSEFVFPSLPMDSPSSSWDPFGALLQQDLPPLGASINIWPSHIHEENLLPWIDVYFKRLHQTIPFLDRADMYREMLTRKHHLDPQYGAMLLSLCAFAMTQPVQIHERASTPSRSVQARMLMDECVKMRVAADFGENPSIEMILTSFFLSACLLQWPAQSCATSITGVSGSGTFTRHPHTPVLRRLGRRSETKVASDVLGAVRHRASVRTSTTPLNRLSRTPWH